MKIPSFCLPRVLEIFLLAEPFKMFDEYCDFSVGFHIKDVFSTPSKSLILVELLFLLSAVMATRRSMRGRGFLKNTIEMQKEATLNAVYW